MMKHFYLLVALALLFVACRKENFDSNNPRNGQIISVFVDHYMSGGDGRYFLNADRNVKFYTFVNNFQRDRGYSYVIKAKVVKPDQPLQDGPSYWFEYISTISKEKYQGNDTLVLPVFGWVAPGNAIFMWKLEGSYTYSGTKLIPNDDKVKATMDSIFTAAPGLIEKGSYPNYVLRVQYAPNDFPNYIVYSVSY